jgi:hypothetical protein
MATTELTLGDRMAAAIDRQLASCEAFEWGDDLSDDAFRQAYEELSRRGIDPGDIERALERAREIRNAHFGSSALFGPPPPDHQDRREWDEYWRGRLVGYFAMHHRLAESGADGEHSGPGQRVRFDDGTWTITVDSQNFPVDDVLMYRVWKVVYEAGLAYVKETEVMAKMGRNVPLTIHKKRSKLPKPLREMLVGEPGQGYSIRLGPAPDGVQ